MRMDALGIYCRREGGRSVKWEGVEAKWEDG